MDDRRFSRPDPGRKVIGPGIRRLTTRRIKACHANFWLRTHSGSQPFFKALYSQATQGGAEERGDNPISRVLDKNNVMMCSLLRPPTWLEYEPVCHIRKDDDDDDYELLSVRNRTEIPGNTVS